MKRYEGLLRPQSRPAPWPSRWIVVAVDGGPIPVMERRRVRLTGLSRWAVAVIEMRGEIVSSVTRSQGDSTSSLWELLGAASARSGLTWAISPRALYAWTLLGLWERLLLGDVQVACDRPARRRPAPDRGLNREPGLLMVGDPPTAAGLLIGPERRRVTWTCARNYGWEIDAASGDASTQVDMLVRAIAAASAAIKRHSLGGWCPTVGSMAMRAWRSQHMGGCLYVDECEQARQILRSANCGGRVICRDAGTITRSAYHVDARGCYGYISYRHHLPIGLRRHGDGRGASADSVGDRAAQTVARVRLSDARWRYPVRSAGRVTYPHGPCETVLCGPELAEAIKLGLVSQIGEYCEYDMGQPVCDFQLACYCMRCAAERDGSRETAALAKGLGVALIGKLHSYGEVWEECLPDYNDPLYGTWQGPDGRGGTTEYRAVAGQVSRRRRHGLSASAVPAIALWTWSYGRIWLHRRIYICGWDNVLYAHTDGLVLTADGYARLVDAGMVHREAWGELRLKAGPVECEILGPYSVRIGDEVISPGVPRDQRGEEYATDGHWFRRPWDGGGGSYGDGQWEERQRAGGGSTVAD